MLLLLCIAVGAYWLIRRARKPPIPTEENPDKFGKEVDIKTLLGTLSFAPKLESRENSSRYWLYVDGRIVTTRASPESHAESLKPVEVLLVPGEYNVEVGTTTPDGDDSGSTFPFEFRSQKVTIQAGHVSRVSLSVEPMRYGEPTPIFALVDPSSEWFEAWVRRVDSEIQAFQKDATQQAFLDVFNALRQSPPARASVYINLPAEKGGGREFDADEVRLMVGWLKRHRSRTLSALPADFVARMPDDMRLRYDQVLKAINSYQDYVAQFEEIATKLAAARH